MAIILVSAYSCDSNDEATGTAKPSDYLPMKKGMFLTYDVTETIYTLGVATSSAYELKTTVADSIANSNSGYDYVIYRYKKLPDQSTWTYLDTWSATINNHEAVINESNIPFLKLKTPVTTGLEWDGNTYNNEGKDVYTMEDINTSHTYSGVSFNDCITVKQSDNGDFIVFLDQRQEIFSKAVGLIYKETTQLHYCTQPDDCLGQQIVEEGLIYKQTIKSYGTE